MDEFAAELKLAHAGLCAFFHYRATASVAESEQAERLPYNRFAMGSDDRKPRHSS